MFRFRTVLACLFILISSSAQADPSNPIIAALIQQARQQQLASQDFWLALLHYERGGNDSRIRSEIHSPGFFLSPQGQHNPSAELEATLQAFFRPLGEDHNEHAQCRFPARLQWLKQQLNWTTATAPKPVCSRYQAWSLQDNIESISLVFATGYLDNPASFFGHILLKFNPSRIVQPYDLLDQSINFGAIVPDHEHPLVYITKGLFGGYEAGFTHEQFYFHNHNYADNELRDLWEYQLSLSPDEARIIAYHAWELLGQKFTYYFLQKNCAYQIAELLGLVVKDPLLSKRKFWAAPVDVFNHLATIEHQGQPLLSELRRIPSRQNRFIEKYQVLSSVEQQIIDALVLNNLNFSIPDYARRSDVEKSRLLDCLLDYYEFRSIASQHDSVYKPFRHKVLLEMSTLPAFAPPQDTPHDIASPPHQGPLSTSLRLSLLNNDELGSGFQLNFRPTYYDFLGLEAGRLPHSQLAMFDTALVFFDDHIRLRYLDLVNIETLNLSQTQLPGDGGMAWKVKFGFEQHNLQCTDCDVFNVNGALGKAMKLGSNTILAGMLGIHAQSNYKDIGTYAHSLEAILTVSPSAHWKSRLSLSQKNYPSSSLRKYITHWENRFFNHRSWDVRVNYRKDIAREISTGISIYW